MNAIDRNHRDFIMVFTVMLVITLAVIAFGMIFYPYSAFIDPNSGPISGLIDSPQGNIMVFAMFGVLAVNMAVFFTRITQLERERADLLAQQPAQQRSGEVRGPSTSGSIDAPKQ